MGEMCPLETVEKMEAALRQEHGAGESGHSLFTGDIPFANAASSASVSSSGFICSQDAASCIVAVSSSNVQLSGHQKSALI
jgi:hypothetical protein